MNRTLSNLVPALLLALLMLVASGLAVVAPGSSWPLVAGPLLLVIGLVGIDLVLNRRAGRSLPSAGALIMAAAMVVAYGIVASSGFDRLAELIPLFGCCATIPLVLRRDVIASSCRRG